MVYLLDELMILNYHRLDGLNNRNLFVHSCGDEDRDQGAIVMELDLSSWLADAAFSLCAYLAFPQCIWRDM